MYHNYPTTRPGHILLGPRFILSVTFPHHSQTTSAFKTGSSNKLRISRFFPHAHQNVDWFHGAEFLPEKLTVPQLVNKYPTLYETRKFITAFTTARYLSLSWARSIQSISPHPTSLRSILILSSHLRLGPFKVLCIEKLSAIVNRKQ
jgi:hypothetical protein